MRRRFGWGLPPGVSDRMIEEQAGAFEEEEMGQGMKKLVEEIATILHGFWARTLEDRTTTGLIDLENEYAKDVITRIGKAYADGELELPGEVIRERMRGAEHPWGIGLKVGDILIALRKEEQP